MLPLPGNTEPPSRPNLFRPLDIAKSGLTAYRTRMEVAATNIANAETTRTEGGGPYRRRTVRLEEGTRNGLPAFPPLTADPTRPGGSAAPSPTDALGGVEVVAIEEDPSEGPVVYNPGHPDANAEGFVRMPNVRVTDEVIDLMDARRLYEANATVFQAARQMLRRALDL
ncbi:MAG: flagellar basal body rod protein FlgC [Gemmatimonadetes bacterium]|nr:flagellar basal body rod protein FlgC [Gemmatimonadota bacterium]